LSKYLLKNCAEQKTILFEKNLKACLSVVVGFTELFYVEHPS